MPTREQDILIVPGRSICQIIKINHTVGITVSCFAIDAAEADVYCPWNREEMIDDRCGLVLSERTRRLKSRYRETQALT